MIKYTLPYQNLKFLFVTGLKKKTGQSLEKMKYMSDKEHKIYKSRKTLNRNLTRKISERVISH